MDIFNVNQMSYLVSIRFNFIDKILLTNIIALTRSSRNNHKYPSCKQFFEIKCIRESSCKYKMCIQGFATAPGRK